MIQNHVLTIEPSSPMGSGWSLSTVDSVAARTIRFPAFHLDGQLKPCEVSQFVAAPPTARTNGVTHHRLIGKMQSGLGLEIEYRLSDHSPVVRFRYRLTSDTPVRLTKPAGTDALRYAEFSLGGYDAVQEVQFSQFNSLLHTFYLAENDIPDAHFQSELSCMGSLLIGAGGSHSFLVAYEHGSQVPDAFVQFDLSPDRNVVLRAVKGNYHDGQIVDKDNPFTTIWLQAGLAAGGADDLARAYRDFVHRDLSENRASRTPYIFYNTWAYQERVKAWQKRPYLADMNETRMLAEIDVAARMGIDVFVIDTGWYEKTGDWRVSSERFPNGLAPIVDKLRGYGMKLGLWFNPTVAALSSEMHRKHSDCLMTVQGKPHDPHEVWETEASQPLCLVSRYGAAFAQELIRLNREVGVTYFKWDAIGQYGCDGPGHGHGDTHNNPEERRLRYGFELGAAMARVVDAVCAACPDAIVDFDITEGGRTVGLQFLASGKYFLINNGPYNFDYDMPIPADGNVNLFFFPGVARGWVCRAPLTYDKWIPSVLFLTHYLPDDRYTKYGWNGNREMTDAQSQWVNLASLVLGQNGIWGDLLAVTEDGVARIGDFLRRYKTVRDEITAASLIRTGAIGGSPEVYEKISPAGCGVVSIFASAPGVYTIVTHAANISADYWHNDGVEINFVPMGRARITATFAAAGAKVVFFGVPPDPIS